MGIRFACHACGKRLNIKNDLAGRRGVCPACSAKIRIPLSDADTSTPIDDELQRSASMGETVASTATSASKPPLPDDEFAPLREHAPEATWYVRPPNGGQYGPASTVLLREWIAEGRVAATALLWREGWPHWRMASDALPELAGQLPGELASGRTAPISDGQQGAATMQVAAAPRTPAREAGFPLAVGTATMVTETQPTGGQSAGIQSTSAGASFVGQSTVGAQRRVRSSRRVFWIGLLSAVAIMLVGVLVVVANLG
jgi:hypothetical protein